jgi:polyhydroxybutyrate depolymerase
MRFGALIATLSTTYPLLCLATLLSAHAQPAITRQPLSITVGLGGSPTYIVYATGNGTLQYQWRFRGQDIPGATAPSLRLPPVGIDQLGAYTVLVKDSVGEIESAPATLSIIVILTPDFDPGLKVTVSDKLILRWKGEGTVQSASSPAGPWINLTTIRKDSFSTALPVTPTLYRLRNPHPRPAKVFIPSSYRPANPIPLVLFLHGYGSTGDGYESEVQIQPLAESRGFIYSHPDGVKDNANKQFWNASQACCNFDSTGVDDSAYLSQLILKIAANYTVDRDRIHFTGHSNGAFMDFRMAMDHSDLIASIAPIGGTMDQQSTVPPPTAPVSVLEMHGTSDQVVLYNGGSLGGGLPVRGTYTSAREVVRRWAVWNGCGDLQDHPQPELDMDRSLPGLDTIITSTTCPTTRAVELWSIRNAAHWPNLSTNFTSNIIDWLLAHPKPR